MAGAGGSKQTLMYDPIENIWSRNKQFKYRIKSKKSRKRIKRYIKDPPVTNNNTIPG